LHFTSLSVKGSFLFGCQCSCQEFPPFVVHIFTWAPLLKVPQCTLYFGWKIK